MWELEFIQDGGKYIHDGKGSFPLGSKFGIWKVMFEICASNQTFVPFLNGWKFLQVQLFMVCLARSCAARASFQIARWELSQSLSQP